MKVRWRWKLQRVTCTAGLSSELSSCYFRCTLTAEEADYDVMYSKDGAHLTFKKQTVSKLWFSKLFSGPDPPIAWAG
jgi:hypothetical protein